MKTHKIAVIAGDGIGNEVMPEGLRVLQAAAAKFNIGLEFTTMEWANCDYYLQHGKMMPDDWREQLEGFDAIYFGAAGMPSKVPDHISLWGSLIKFRRDFDQYVNLRPSKLWPGTTSPLAGVKPGEIDMVVVREGTEGLYVGAGGVLHQDTPAEIATEESLNTRHGVERVVRDAFARAQRRPRKKLTLVHKTNVLVYAGSLWWRLVQAVAADFPDVTVDYIHVDAAMIFLATDPARFDVIVTDNLFGDIVTDLAAAITGGIGLAASGNVNPDRTSPSMFEPVHGSAPDIAGQQKADPTAAILSAGLMLDHLGLDDAARRVEDAVLADLAERGSAPRRTSEVGDAIAARVAG